MTTEHTFLIADNQFITQVGLRWLIRQTYTDALIHEVADKRALLAVLSEGKTSVVILDYTLCDFREVEELLVINKRYPTVHWILFSAELGEPLIRRLSIEPAFSLLLKESSAEEIRAALAAALSGKYFHCHAIESLLSSRPQPKEEVALTPTEREVLRLIASGKTVKEIAALRNSSVHTIITHKKNLFRKLEVNNVYEATKYALKAGLIELVEYYI